MSKSYLYLYVPYNNFDNWIASAISSTKISTMSFFCLPLEDVGQLFGILSPLISLSKRTHCQVVHSSNIIVR